MTTVARMRKRVRRLKARLVTVRDLTEYRGRPVEYAREVLKATLTPDQEEILRALFVPPCRVLVASAHAVGKTFVAAAALNHHFDCYDPGVGITTAPTQRDVVDLLWTEVRIQRLRAGLSMPFIGPKAPEMFDTEQHYAKGYTAVKGESFQGRHRPNMLFGFDEANGVPAMYWTTTRTMFDPAMGHRQLAIFNPTDTTSQAYQEDILCDESATPRWHRFRLSALRHPNVVEGRQVVPGAVSREMVNEWVRDWCDPVTKPEDVRATDVEWPPGSGKFYRPGPIFQSRALGIWPDKGSGVWSPATWEACQGQPPPFDPRLTPEIGCDCAEGKGEDYHAIHGRWGVVSVHHETANTMDEVKIFGRLKDCAGALADLLNSRRPASVRQVEPTEIPIKLDDDGTGHAIGAFLAAAGYKVVLIGAGTAPLDPQKYAKRRDELWFHAAEFARRGLVNVGLLPQADRARLRQQLLAVEWTLDPAGRRTVERKDETKEKIGRSPDDADAMNLAYVGWGGHGDPVLIDNPTPQWTPEGRRGTSHARRRNVQGLR
jgi:hypothetical protein